MQIKTYGNFDNKKMLLLHPMMTDEKIFTKLIPKLCKEYYVVVPILSGHYPNSTYRSILKEELDISIFLKSHNINKIDLLMGIDIGGNIAYDFFYKNTDIIDKVIIDSAPLYKKNYFIKKYYYYKYRNIIINVLRHRNEREEILDKYFNEMGKHMKDVAPLMNETSLRSLMMTRYGVKIYNLNKKNQEKITFVYGERDKNKSAIRRIKKYKYSTIIKVKNVGNSLYPIKKPTSYINKIINREG